MQTQPRPNDGSGQADWGQSSPQLQWRMDDCNDLGTGKPEALSGARSCRALHSWAKRKQPGRALLRCNQLSCSARASKAPG